MTGRASSAGVDVAALGQRAATAATALLAQAARQQWRGPDPYDGLYHAWPEWLVGGKRRRQAIVQFHARSPLDVRRLYRRSDPRIAKALAVFGSAGIRLASVGDRAAAGLALEALGRLEADREAGPRAWGYPFDVQTRWSFYPAGSPNVVVTSFAVQGLLDGAGRFQRPDFAERARTAARWVLEELWVQPEGFFAYHPGASVNIHNANLLGALCVGLALGDDPSARDRVRRAVQRTVAAQAADGGFAYGEGPGLEWRDSFHTGFVLRCLALLQSLDPSLEDVVRRALPSYLSFFDGNGRARLWAGKPYPEDAHSAGTGLSTLSLLARREMIDPALVVAVTRRTLDAGLRKGHAVARRYRWGPTLTAYLRWCDAHVALGLADAALVLER